jgi:hypothetical protein
MWRGLILFLGLMVGFYSGLIWAQEKKSGETDKAKIESLASQQGKQEKLTLELKAKIEELIKQLGDTDWKTREAAQEELTNIGQPALLPLIDALDYKDPEVRLRTESILTQMEPELTDGDIILLDKKTKNLATGTVIRRLLNKWLGEPVNGLRLSIRPDKKVYSLSSDKQINLTAQLKNVSQENIFVCTGFHVSGRPKAFYLFEITGPEGIIEATIREANFSKGTVTGKDFITLKPQMYYEIPTKQVSSNQWDICALRREKGKDKIFEFSCLEEGDTTLHWELSQPGIYKIRLKYKNENNGKAFDLKAWTGEVVSNTITLEIKE